MVVFKRACLVCLAGAAILLSGCFCQNDIGDILPPQEAQRYTYAFLSAPEGHFLAKIDVKEDVVVKKYPIKSDIAPSTIDRNGNLYLRNFNNIWSRDKVFVFYPRRERFKKILRSDGGGLLKVFSYKDKLYVLCSEQKEHRGSVSRRGSGLEIYDLATKKRLKIIYLNDFGVTTGSDCWVDYQKGLFVSVAADLQAFGLGGDIERLYFHIIDLNVNNRVVNKNLDAITMGGARVTGAGDNVILSRAYAKLYECKDYEKNHISALIRYSLADDDFKEVIRFENKNDAILYLCHVNNKLYAEIDNSDGFSGLRIVDTKKWKTLKEIPFYAISQIVKVGRGKIYLDAMKTEEDDSNGIYVLDTKTDRITKFIKGHFLSIAENAWYY